MKKVSLFTVSVVLSLPLIAGDAPNLPPVPGMPAKKSLVKKKEQNDSCKVIPPMLVYLPPMLEKDLYKCKNSIHMPTVNTAEKGLKSLLKRDVKVLKISIVKGFNMLYKIESDMGSFYCNRYVNRCLTSSLKVIE